jgi:crotonobetainyl-CoA:carnitine CoA-transferase CaiB-like acyl-CoA transferase
VLDIATFVAAPFCGTILADFGAEVIKIEQPDGGDALRKFGTKTECGDSLVWLSEARNKKTATLDLRTPRGAELFRSLVKISDVVLENFRPGTLEKWGLGYEDLKKINPNLIMLRVSAYGQTGPKKNEPGFARIAHAFGGLSFLAGMPDGPPVVPGSTSLADYISGMWGAIGVLIALRARDQQGIGQYIDIGLYESVFRLLDEIAPAYARSGFIRRRLGPDTVNVTPHSHYETKSGDWVAIACTSDKMFERLAAMVGRPEMASDPDFTTSEARYRRISEVNKIVSDWAAQHDLESALRICGEFGVPCGKIYSIEDIFNDAQYRARENLMTIVDERVGELVLPSAVPRLSETPAEFKTAGRALGADNAEVFGAILKLRDDEIQHLKQSGVI